MLNTIYHVYNAKTLKSCLITGYDLLRDVAHRASVQEAKAVKRNLKRRGEFHTSPLQIRKATELELPR